jgi:NitT/TauT family transport system ATP-binding protein
MSEKLARAEELLKKYGLYAFKDKKPRFLSGGMRQRVALIRTLALEPELLLLDEPFSALDFQTRLSVCDDVYEIIKSEEKTALLVTHDISEAISMSDKIIVLSSRPATVRDEILPNLPEKSPLKRRENAKFSTLFDLIWRELTNEEKK